MKNTSLTWNAPSVGRGEILNWRTKSRYSFPGTYSPPQAGLIRRRRWAKARCSGFSVKMWRKAFTSDILGVGSKLGKLTICPRCGNDPAHCKKPQVAKLRRSGLPRAIRSVPSCGRLHRPPAGRHGRSAQRWKTPTAARSVVTLMASARVWRPALVTRWCVRSNRQCPSLGSWSTIKS